MKLINQLLTESQEDQKAAIAKWMRQHGVSEYELFPDGSVVINQSVTYENNDSILTFGHQASDPLPFSQIKAINGDVELQFHNGSTRQVNKLINQINGYAVFFVTADCPILSIPRIKGMTGVDIVIFDVDMEELDVDAERIGRLLTAVTRGEADILELQDHLIDMGLGRMAKL